MLRIGLKLVNKNTLRLAGFASGATVVTFAGLDLHNRAYCDAAVALPKPIVSPKQQTIITIEKPPATVTSWQQKICNVVKKAQRMLTYMHRILQYLFYGVPVATLVPIAYYWSGGRVEDMVWSYLVWTIEQLGPTFIKFAQWASSRPDIFPMQLINRLKRLQDDVRVTHSRSTVEQTLIEAFDGDGWKEHLKLDYDHPLGAGCVAQVFKGELTTAAAVAAPAAGGSSNQPKQQQQQQGKTSNTTATAAQNTIKVAVKLIHPHVERVIKIDMELLGLLADYLDSLPNLEILSVGDTCRQFADMMREQLDLRTEAAHLRKFNANFKNEPWLVFPEPIDAYVRKNVLVETFMEGIPLKKIMEAPVDEKMRKFKIKLSDLGVRAILKMLFFDNFIHGDLHPGNVMVQYQPNGEPRFVFLDCGLVFRAKTKEEHEALYEICYAFMKHDGYSAGKYMVDNSKRQAVGNVELFCQGMQQIVIDAEAELFYEHYGEYLAKICEYARTYHVKLDPNYFHIAMVLKVGEGIALNLHREIDLITKCIPIIVKARTLQKLGIQKFPLPEEDEK